MCLAVVPVRAEERVWQTGNAFVRICSVEVDKGLKALTLDEIKATSDCLPYVIGLHQAFSLSELQRIASAMALTTVR